jgi:uncharacterized protein (TIGR02466 family)
MIHNYFETKVYKKKFTGNLEKIQNYLIPSLDKIFEESLFNNQASMRDGGICSFNVHDNIHKNFDISEIADFVESCANDYWKELNYIDSTVTIDHSWVNRYPPGSYIDLHNHIPAALVSSFYLKKPDNSGKLIFENPLSTILRYQPFKGLHDKNVYVNSFESSIEAEEGDLVIWPGYLMHKTEKNNSDHDRIILGFNLKYEYKL